MDATPLAATAETALKPGDSFKECRDCLEMIVAPPASFIMGSPDCEGEKSEHPQHDVKIMRAFAVAKFPLTFDQRDACAAHGDCFAHVSDDGWGRGLRPAVSVSWDHAQTYVKWLSRITGKPYRLLYEAEYEYATRGGTATRYPWGDDPEPSGKAMANCNGCGGSSEGKGTTPVGSFPANAFGLYDMVGDVWEYTEDCWSATYQGAPADGSPWTTGDCRGRVVRGGCWYYGADRVRSTARLWWSAIDAAPSIGFRVARTLADGGGANAPAPAAH